MPLEEDKGVWRSGPLDGGLITALPAHMLRPNQSPDAANFDPTYIGRLRKRLGYVKFTSSAKTSPTGSFVSGLCGGVIGTTEYILAAEGTALHNISAGDWNTTISGVTLTADTMVRMKMFNDLFIICNVGGGPYKWGGSGAALALGGSPPANAAGLEVHRSRVWMWKGTDSVLYWSALANPEDWTTADNAGNMTINKGDGYVINGMVSGGDFAVISKKARSSTGNEGALYILYGSSPYDFQVRKIATVGAYTHEAMVPYDDFVAVATPRGILGIQGRRRFKMSKPIESTYNGITDGSTMAAGRYKNTLRFSYKSGSYNDRELILDVERGVWGLNTGKTIRVYANHPDGRLLLGSSSTSILVWRDEYGTNDDGSAINFYWTTPNLTFGAPEASKRLSSAHVYAANTGNYSISIEHYIEGTAQTYGGTMNVSTEDPVKKFTFFNKIGKYHSLKLTNNAADQPIEVYNIDVYAQMFEPGN